MPDERGRSGCAMRSTRALSGKAAKSPTEQTPSEAHLVVLTCVRLRVLQRQLYLRAHQVVLLPLRSVRPQQQPLHRVVFVGWLAAVLCDAHKHSPPPLSRVQPPLCSSHTSPRPANAAIASVARSAGFLENTDTIYQRVGAHARFRPRRL
jgi:hypothetical protein